MPSSMPLYYAGVASDDDVLEEMLNKDKKLVHGSSSTIDLQRLLGVSYQHVPLSRVKKMTAAVITVVAIILFISLSFHSAATSENNTQAIATSTSPTGKYLASDHVILDTSSKASSKQFKDEKRDSIATSDFKITTTTMYRLLTENPSPTPHRHTTKRPTTHPMTHIPTHTHQTQHPSKLDRTDIVPITTRKPSEFVLDHTDIVPITTRKPSEFVLDHTDIVPIPTRKPSEFVLDHTDIVPIPTRKPSEFVLAMNPSIPAKLNLDCRSCAVVTNSADLYNSNAGSVVDSSDCVIRLNTAPTIAHEDDVGGKTTVRVVSQDHLGNLLHHVWHDPDEMSSISYIMTYGRENALCPNCTFFKLFKKVAGEYLGDKFVRYTKTFKTKIDSHKDSEEVNLSTQFHAINIMRNVCNKMRVFGVERNHPCLSGRSYRKSYWRRNKFVSCDGRREDILKDIRRYRLEKKIYDQWRDRYDLEFLYP